MSINRTKINILYLVSTLEGTGPNRQQYYIFKHLDRDIFSPQVLTLSPEPRNSIIELYRKINITITSLNLTRFEGQFKASKIINKFISDNDINLVHSFGFRGDSLSLKLNIPTLSAIRNYPYEEYPTLYGKIIGTSLAFKHLNVIKKLKNKVTCSHGLANYYKIKNKIKIKVIQNAIDTNIYFRKSESNKNKQDWLKNLSIPNSSKIFITSSKLIPRKNIDIIIKAFNKYYKNNKNYTLLIVGEGPEKSQLELLAQSSSNIIFLGYQDNMTVLYQMSDYFISSSYAEGLPNSVLEAMSCGLPCILSNITMHTEIFEKSKNLSYFFNPNSIDELYDKIDKITSINYSTLSEKCADHINDNFNAKKMSLQYQDLYRKIVKKI